MSLYNPKTTTKKKNRRQKKQKEWPVRLHYVTHQPKSIAGIVKTKRLGRHKINKKKSEDNKKKNKSRHKSKK